MYNEEETYPIAQNPAMFSYNTEASLQYQLEPTEIIEEIERTIRGEIARYDEETGSVKYEVPEGITPMINQKGINSVIALLKSRLTKIFILSDFDNNDITLITRGVGENIIDDFYYNWEDYEIRDQAAASMILNIICDTVYSTLRKGYQGNYLKFLRTTHSIQEMQHRAIRDSPPPQQQTENPLNFLFKKRK